MVQLPLKGQTCTDYVFYGPTHNSVEIQENAMLPTYENDFVLCKHEVYIV